jgi:hypothetical protein
VPPPTLGVNLDGLADSDDEEDPYTYLSIRTGELDTKATAILALGLIAENSGPAFTSDGHLKTSLSTLLSQTSYFHAKVAAECRGRDSRTTSYSRVALCVWRQVRREVVLALQRMVTAVVVGRTPAGKVLPAQLGLAAWLTSCRRADSVGPRGSDAARVAGPGHCPCVQLRGTPALPRPARARARSQGLTALGCGVPGPDAGGDDGRRCGSVRRFAEL